MTEQTDHIPELPGKRIPISYEEFASRWSAFEANYPTEETCIDRLWELGILLGLIYCKGCGHREFERKLGGRFGSCKQCKSQHWFMSGTFFERAKKLKAWTFTIEQVQLGAIISPEKVHSTTGLGLTSSQNLIKKIATLLDSESDPNAFAVPSYLFMAIFFKRSRETVAGEHPKSEEQALQTFLTNKTRANFDSTANSPNTSSIDAQGNDSKCTESQLSDEENTIMRLLGSGQVDGHLLFEQSKFSESDFDAAIAMLEIQGKLKSLPGDRFVRVNKGGNGFDIMKSLSLEVLSKVEAMIDYGLNRLFGISRKHLQKHIALFDCYKDNSRWKDGQLLAKCLAAPPIRYTEIVSYVTPLMVRMAS
jgi:hypothetical protein